MDLVEEPVLMSREEAGYRQSDGTTACANCAQFISPDKCQLVAGKLAPGGVCDYHAPIGQGGMEDPMAMLFGPSV